MARNTTDPFELLIADGRVVTRPLQHFGLPTVIDVDLDIIATNLANRLNAAYLHYLPVRNCYFGTVQTVTTTIQDDISALVNLAIGVTYNRLRTVLEKYHPAIRTSRMNTRCPINNRYEFPTFVSSTLGSIGPFRLMDSIQDKFVVYATVANRMQSFGRAGPTVLNEGRYERLLGALKAANIQTAPIDAANTSPSSYFPTITHNIEEYVWTVYGTVHHSHYENEDVPRALLLANSTTGLTAFENVGLTLGYCDTAAVTTAIAAVAPTNLPTGSTATSAGRPVGATHRINFYGIQPGTAAQGDNAATPSGVYILGRGDAPIFTYVLAHDISETEALDFLRHRLRA